MMTTPPVQFWFECASTYSYPAAMRIEKLAADKANQARQLQADLHALLRTWYGYRWHTLLGEVERAPQGEPSAADLQRQIQAPLARLEADLQAQRARPADLRQPLGVLLRAASALHRPAAPTQPLSLIHI